MSTRCRVKLRVKKQNFKRSSEEPRTWRRSLSIDQSDWQSFRPEGTRAIFDYRGSIPKPDRILGRLIDASAKSAARSGISRRALGEIRGGWRGRGANGRTVLLDSSESFGISFSELILKTEQTALYTTKREEIARACGDYPAIISFVRVTECVFPQHREKERPSREKIAKGSTAMGMAEQSRASSIIQERCNPLRVSIRGNCRGNHRGIAMLARYRASNGVTPGRVCTPTWRTRPYRTNCSPQARRGCRAHALHRWRGAYCTLISFCGNWRRAAERDGERTRPCGYFIPFRVEGLTAR